MELHNQEIIQKRFLDVKYILLNHNSDVLQWYESTQPYGETWGLSIPPYPTLYKGNSMGDGSKIQFLSSEMMSKSLYTRKLIAKILKTKTMFGSKCSYFK